MENIRNFVIISHIDHGKSTLADRLLELTGTIDIRQMKPQFLDSLESERERGITIKMAPVRMKYYSEIKNAELKIQNKNNNSKSLILNSELLNSGYILNLIDTPGHPDFSYEVSRALAAVEGAVLLVDITQGIQAQTLAKFYAAKKQGLKIIGAVNKIDLLSADKRGHDIELRRRIEELANLTGCQPEKIHKISGKTGEGVRELLEAIIKYIPAPKEPAFLFEKSVSEAELAWFSDEVRKSEAESQRANESLNERDPVFSKIKPLAKALIFDSFYDDHKGIIASVRIFNGEFKDGDEVNLIVAGEKFKIKELGYFSPSLSPSKKITSGEIGYIVTGLKDTNKVKIGDTILLNPKSKILNPKIFALVGYSEPKPVVFVSFYPDDADNYEELKNALQKLRLNDSALNLEADFNEVLGRGFKVGFLGKLHFEITAERLEKEFNVKVINTFPSVAYKVKARTNVDINADKSGYIGENQRGNQRESAYIIIENPANLPDDFEEIFEPMINIEIIVSIDYLGNIFQLKENFRMENFETKNLAERVLVTAKMPLAELISDFDDKLKSVSEGFASFNYELAGYQKADLEKMQILVAGNPVAGLVRVIPRGKIEREARKIVEKLKDILPRQQFSQAIQAKVGNRIIARETIPALKKDVTGYLYGGDRSRKMKLWKKQKRGKKKLLGMANVKIPADVFKKIIQ